MRFVGCWPKTVGAIEVAFDNNDNLAEFPVTMSYLAAFSEIFGSWLLIFGLGTRLGALAILGTVSFGIYHAIVTSGFNIYLLELLVLYWGGCACIILNGGGNFSLDHLIKRRLTND